jgi:hypothetical protein
LLAEGLTDGDALCEGETDGEVDELALLLKLGDIEGLKL